MQLNRYFIHTQLTLNKDERIPKRIVRMEE